jgi:hypothetical protein
MGKVRRKLERPSHPGEFNSTRRMTQLTTRRDASSVPLYASTMQLVRPVIANGKASPIPGPRGRSQPQSMSPATNRVPRVRRARPMTGLTQAKSSALARRRAPHTRRFDTPAHQAGDVGGFQPGISPESSCIELVDVEPCPQHVCGQADAALPEMGDRVGDGPAPRVAGQHIYRYPK